MKVLMYVWELPPHISGGLGVACHGIIQGLLNHQTKVTAILPDRCTQLDSLFTNATHLKITQLPLPGVTLNLKSYNSRHEQNILTAVLNHAQIAGTWANKVTYDLIHAHDWLTILAGIEAKRISHNPLVFHIHSLEAERNMSCINKTIFDIEKYGLEICDVVIAVSEFTKQNIIHYYNIPAEKIFVAHNGLFKNQIRTAKAVTHQIPDPKYKTILFLGRLTYQKAPLQFIEAAAKLLEHRKDVQFVIAGDGDLFRTAVERVAELRLGTDIHFTKFLNREQVELIYQKSQVYVQASTAEPFGITCLEAIAQHVPVILSKQSGVSEVIKNTLKVDFWDINEIATQMSALLDYPPLRQELIENAVPELYPLTWDNTAQKILEIYEKSGFCAQTARVR